jgi:hypothetical protein
MSRAVLLNPDGVLRRNLRRGKRAVTTAHQPAIAIKRRSTTRFSESVDFDQALGTGGGKQFDYLLFTAENGDRIYLVEVHPAHTGNVNEVIEKRRASLEWLSQNEPALHAVAKDEVLWWISTASVRITPNSPQARRLSLAQVRIVGQLVVS